MPRLKSGDRVRCNRGQTVDTGHFLGGDLRGTRGTVMSKVYEANGVDGPKGQKRVALALEDTGIVSVPVEHLEPVGIANRIKTFVGGFGPGKLRRNCGYEAPPLRTV